MSCHFASSTGLTVPKPLCYISGNPSPHKSGRDEAPGSSGCWVRQAVQGIEDEAAMGNWYMGRTAPVETSHQRSTPSTVTTRVCKQGETRASCVSAQPACATGMAAKSMSELVAAKVAGAWACPGCVTAVTAA
jgi:hypothetical protein